MEALYVHIANKLEAIRKGPSLGGNKVFNIEELKSLALWRAVFAEFLAQIFFVFLGCCSIYGADTTTTAFQIKVAFAFGLAIMALIQIIGHVSGGHINPAVTIAMAVAMNISIIRAVLYVIAQILGAIIGGYIVKGITPSTFHNNLGATLLSGNVTQAQGFGMEMMLTFVLVSVIFGSTDPNRPSFGSPALLIGLTVGLGHLTGVTFTGASMNPSRSLGSAVASDNFNDHWVYWVAPIAGGVLAAVVYKLVLNPYRGVVTMDEAINRLNGDENFVAIPRTYFTGGAANGKPGETTHM